MPPAQNSGEQRRPGASDPVFRGEEEVSAVARADAARAAAEKASAPFRAAHRARRRLRRRRRRLQRVRPRRRLQRHVREVAPLQGRLPLGHALHLRLDCAAEIGKDASGGADVSRPSFGVGEPGAGAVAEALEALDAGLGLAAPLLEVGLGLRGEEEFLFMLQVREGEVRFLWRRRSNRAFRSLFFALSTKNGGAAPGHALSSTLDFDPSAASAEPLLSPR